MYVCREGESLIGVLLGRQRRRHSSAQLWAIPWAIHSSVIDRATDPNTHPKAGGDYDPWRRPDPRREYVLSVAFANQIGDAIMVRGADARRRRNRSGGRYATGARA